MHEKLFISTRLSSLIVEQKVGIWLPLAVVRVMLTGLDLQPKGDGIAAVDQTLAAAVLAEDKSKTRRRWQHWAEGGWVSLLALCLRLWRCPLHSGRAPPPPRPTSATSSPPPSPQPPEAPHRARLSFSFLFSRALLSPVVSSIVPPPPPT